MAVRSIWDVSRMKRTSTHRGCERGDAPRGGEQRAGHAKKMRSECLIRLVIYCNLLQSTAIYCNLRQSTIFYFSIRKSTFIMPNITLNTDFFRDPHKRISRLSPQDLPQLAHSYSASSRASSPQDVTQRTTTHVRHTGLVPQPV